MRSQDIASNSGGSGLKSSLTGLGFAVLASLLFALMNASAKGLSSDMAVPEIVFYRGAIGVGLTVVMMLVGKIPFKVSNWPLLVSRGLAGAFSLMLAFTAISEIPLADASFLAHLSPLFTAILGLWLLKERLPKTFFGLLAVALAGVLLIASPWHSQLQAKFVALGTLGALLASFASIAIRQLSKDHNNQTIMLAFLLAATITPVPFVSWSEHSLPQGFPLVLVFFLGTVSFAAQYCLTQAYRLEKAGLVATARYSGIAFNILLGFLFFAEVPTFLALLGGTLILITCLGLNRLARTAWG